jgi:hypothetical protein
METLKQMTVLSAELDARDHVQVDDIRRVGRTITLRSSRQTLMILPPDRSPTGHRVPG